jgi:hypothetical protein
MPKNISNIFVVDITQYLKISPIQGGQNSSNVITFFINKVYSQDYKQHYKSKTFCYGSKFILIRLKNVLLVILLDGLPHNPNMGIG